MSKMTREFVRFNKGREIGQFWQFCDKSHKDAVKHDINQERKRGDSERRIFFKSEHRYTIGNTIGFH